jgi:DNA-binding CsgD family transcriptional regulator/tetratricopeptide (TPR) repeat protein
MRGELTGGVLLERDEQLGLMTAAIDAVRRGSGSVLVLSGPAGVGKTSLLRAAAERARSQGLELLTARAEELERDLGHGVTRQLLDRVVARLDDGERAALLSGAAALAGPVLGVSGAPAPHSASADPEFAARHGLTWLVAGLAERRPIVLVLDDAQWADAPALRWLAYLAQRVDELAVVVLLARRSGEAVSDAAALDAICRAAREIELEPLSHAAVAELVSARTGLTPDDDLVERCLAASGGNPFLLDATLAALDEEGASSLRRPLAGARRVGPVILRRLGRLPADATALARAVAVLGDGAELAAAARLGGLSLDRAAVAADALVAADLFAAGEQLGFAHGLVRDAVAADVGGHALRVAHAQAARVLRGLGVPAERVAPHLLLAPPARDPLAAGDLREAARRAAAQGAPSTAVTLLRRALDEPPPRAERGGVLMELGMAELVSGTPGGSERIDEAIELLDDPVALAAAAQAQTTALIGQGRVDVASLTIKRVRSAVAAHPLHLLTLDALQLALSMAFISLDAERHEGVARLRAALASAPPGATQTRGASALMTAVDAVGGAPSSAVRAAVDDVWEAGTLIDELGAEDIFCIYGVIALCIARELHALESLTTQIAARASADGSVNGVCHGWLWRAFAREGMGRLTDAEADADLTLQTSPPASLLVAEAAAQALQARVCIERGDLAGARERLASIDAGDDAFVTRVSYLVTAAKLARAESARAAELAALRGLQALAGDGEFGTWFLGCWPAQLAIALGPCDEARELADATLRAARARGGCGEIGIALSARALVDDAGPDIERLRAGVAELERSELALDHARALTELGAALRRGGHRADAREPLGLGLEQARRCGATALAEHALTELQATGARPRRMMVTGRDALTPSERRIATLGAEGRSNREIAQTLFVTTKTVETHLSRIFRKLDITRRTQLQDALAQI